MTEHPTPDGAETPAGDESLTVFNTDVPHATPARPLDDAARRALLEAADRRAAQKAAQKAAEKPPEHGGPTGPEPTRYGDWEKKGLAVDF